MSRWQLTMCVIAALAIFALAKLMLATNVSFWAIVVILSLVTVKWAFLIASETE